MHSELHHQQLHQHAAEWNHTFPTGIHEGYDATDRNGQLSPPLQTEIDHSVAATIYALWRSRFAVNVLDQHVQQISAQLPVPGDQATPQALKQLLQDFDTRQGVGLSGIDFFAVPGIADASDRRDFLVLKSLDDALALAASDAFKPVFSNSTRQSDYRWGKLHRVTFSSLLGAPGRRRVPRAGRGRSPAPGRHAREVHQRGRAPAPVRCPGHREWLAVGELAAWWDQ